MIFRDKLLKVYVWRLWVTNRQNVKIYQMEAAYVNF